MSTIKITCKAADVVPIESLQNFQGNLKSLAKAEYAKLKKSIESFGFSFPVFVWKNGDKHNILDGHQRVAATRQMIAEGYTLEGGLPVSWIEAKDEREAKSKVLAATSQYGHMDSQGLYEFIEQGGLSFDEVKETFDFPEIDFGKFGAEFYDEEELKTTNNMQDEDQFIVVITCKDETDQKLLFERLIEEGRDCKLVM